MPQERTKLIRQILQWILGAMIIITGIALIWSCLDIYTSGPRPYSAEAITLRFRKIIIPVCITLAAIIADIVLKLSIHIEEKRRKAPTLEGVILDRLRTKAGVLDGSELALCKKEMRIRYISRIAAHVFFITVMIYPAVYLCNVEHFTVENLNRDIVKAAIIVLLPAMLGLAGYWFCQFIARASMRREIACYKAVLARGNKKAAPANPGQSSSPSVWWARGILLTIAAVWILLGILNGGAADVLKKAIAICTECIGLG